MIIFSNSGARISTFGQNGAADQSYPVRIPDICVALQDPGIDVFEAPPFVCVEILSPRDETSNLLEKLDEYAALGVAHIWVVDPRRRKAFTYSSGKLEEVRGSALDAGAGVSISLAEVFARL